MGAAGAVRPTGQSVRADGRPVPAQQEDRRQPGGRPGVAQPVIKPGRRTRTDFRCPGRPDRGRQRFNAGGHGAAEAQPRRRIHHQSGRTHIAYGDTGAQPGDTRDSRGAQRHALYPQRRRPDRRWQTRRRDRGAGKEYRCRIPAEAEGHRAVAPYAGCHQGQSIGHARRQRHCPVCQYRTTRRYEGSQQSCSRRCRALPHRIPVHEPQRATGRGRAVPGLFESGPSPGWQTRHHTHPRSGRGQARRRRLPAGRGGGDQSGPGPACDTPVPARHRPVPAAITRDLARLRPWQGAHDDPHDLESG